MTWMERLRRWRDTAGVSVTVKIGSVFVLLSLIFGTVLIANAYLTRQLIGASAAINHAGLQRMRVYKLSHLLRRTAPERLDHNERRVLLEEMEAADAVFRGLVEGDPTLGLVGETDPEILSRIERLRAWWDGEVKPALLGAMAGPSADAAASLDRYLTQAPDFASALSQLVLLIEHRLSARVDLLYLLQFAFLLVACALAAGGIYGLHRLVRAPLERLTEGVQRFTEGTLQASIPIRSRDELGQLARAFEMMASNIHTHIEHLEAMHATSEGFSMLGGDGLEQVLRRTTDTAAALVKADLAVLMVRHPVLDCWIVEAASGAAHATMRKQLVMLEETPFACQAFDTRQAVVALDVEKHMKPLLFRDKFGAKSFLIVPLLGARAAIGVLIMLNMTRTRTFTEREKRLATQSASYAAIALENARLFEAAESEAFDLRERLQAVERQIAELTHEVKAPAGRVAEFAAWVQRDYGDRLDERAKRYLEWIRKEGKDLAQLAERTLDFARLIQEPTPLERVDANVVVQEVVDLLADECKAGGIRVILAGDLPHLACRRVHVKQILENLLSNAIKFMGQQPDPRVEIGAEGSGRDVQIYVKDNGVGMDPEMAGRVFLPFQRLGKVEAEGAGIGLTIVKTIVEHYGGTVTVLSAPGAGSTFYVRLPVLDDKWAGPLASETQAKRDPALS